MVLIDSHTISKSIDNDEKIDDIFDSITDLDHTRNPKLRRDRFIHKYRSEYKDELVRPIDALRETKFTETEKATEKTTVIKTTTEHPKPHKSPKRRVGSFWRKFRGKDKKNKHNDAKERERRIPTNREFAWRYPATRDFRTSGPRNKSRRKNRNQFILLQPEVHFAKRRDINGENMLFTSRENKVNKSPANKLQIGITPHLEILKHPYKVKTIQQFKVTDSLDRQLATITTQLTHLKQLYGLDKFNANTYSVTPIVEKTSGEGMSKATAHTSTDATNKKLIENEYPGTAQIEELLNDIKVKAIQMIAEQIPAVTDIITNTVTEATFEADPILTHVDMVTPGYYLSTFVSINDVENMHGKRTVVPTGTNEFNLNDSVLITNTETHNLVTRSIKEDTMTMAQNVEDMLQRELKNIYNKVKNKVSNDFRKEVHKAKSTLKDGITKINSKVTTKSKATPSKTTCCNKTVTPTETNKPSTSSRHSRGEHKIKHNTLEETHPTPTYDDYMMLTLYEQMLEKSHEDNVMKMLSTSDTPVKKRRQHLRLSKRNPETLTDIKLREDIQKIYDEGANMPDYDYVEPFATNSEASSSTTVKDTSNNEAENEEMNMEPSEAMRESVGSNEDSGTNREILRESSNRDTSPMSLATENSIGETSLESLSNKISYNDFVNGYKHYLKFQKEQGSQNFSNLVKYQAHRHHNVDDIGKFILDKIPRLPPPSSRLKRFFDDSDIEDQEVSTKTDDSWFKKHFYLFIDNGPPKKFHTSQTVSLKSAITEPDSVRLFPTDESMHDIPRPGHKEQVLIRFGSDDDTTANNNAEAVEMSLDDISKILDSIKDKQSSHSYYRGFSKPRKESNTITTVNYNATDGVVNIKIVPQSLIGKIFGGKLRRAPKKSVTEYDIQNGNILRRFKRTVQKEDTDNTAMDDLYNKDLEEKTSTGAKEGYGDVAVRSNHNKDTNKYGYVDIDLVPRQTAVVKLRENTSKKSRFKDFFRKFHFKKRKDKKKAKRQCRYMYHTRRRARFNPIKKLKDMFKVKNEDKGPSQGYNIPNMADYEVMTSHIDSFKAIKYDKPLSIDEMKQQIPNISEVNFEPEMTKASTKFSPYFFKLDDNDRNLLYHYHIDSTVSAAKLSPRPTKIKATTTAARINKTTKPTTMKLTVQKQKLPPSNVMTVNVKTLKPQPPPTVNIKETTPVMTLDDMNVVLNKIQYKLAKTPRNYIRYTTPLHYPIYSTSFHYPLYSTSFHYPLYSTAFHKRGTMRTRTASHIVQCRKPLEDLTIKSKLTRIAKFPISRRHLKNKYEDLQQTYFGGKDYISFQDGPISKEYWHEMRNRYAFPEKKKSKLALNSKKLNNSGPAKGIPNEKCRYTDYFNDLLMWHNDILNLDKVPSPLWKSILQDIQTDTGESFTTPNMNNLMEELNEMNDFLDEGTVLNRLTVTPYTTSMNETGMARNIGNSAIRSVADEDNQGVIRSVAMHDDAIVTSKDMIIKGEAKYFQYNKPKILDKSGAFITKLNMLDGLNKVQYKENQGKGGRRDSSSTVPAILVDTSLLAYDDNFESITNGLIVKKLSRNSQKSTKAAANKGPLHFPILKTNKAPMQYYTTPLPMKSFEFEKFLKENRMDVESVTSPILELPTFIETWPKTAKPGNLLKDDLKALQDAMDKTRRVELTTKKLKMDKLKTLTTISKKAMKFTNKLLVNPRPLQNTSHIYNRRNRFFDNFDRYKRYNEYPRNNFMSLQPNKPTQESHYYNLIKKKIKLFDKKQTGPMDKISTDIFTLDPRNKEVEITIINFDDLDKMTTQYKAYDTFALSAPSKDEPTSMYTEFAESKDTTESMSRSVDYNTQKETSDAMHNELLYKDIFREFTSTTTEFSPVDFPNKNTEYVESETTEQPTSAINNKLRYPFDFLNKIPHAKSMNLPKRVHISSHHYKYDIFYNDEKKNMKVPDGLRPKLSVNTATTPNMIKQQFLTNKRSPTSEKGETSADVNKKIYKFGKKHRQARDANKAVTEAEADAQPGSLVYDLKHLNSSSVMPFKGRHRRLFKISSLIQDRFKMLMKNTSSTTKSSTNSKRAAKCNCTCTGAKADHSSEPEEELEESKCEGFKFSCGPDEVPEHHHSTTTLVTTTQELRATHRHTTEMEELAPAPEPPHYRPCFKHKGHPILNLPNDTLYMEPDTYDDQAYYESGPMEKPPCRLSTKGTEDPLELANKEHYDIKRDLQTQNTFTAKDVAALEVIVDLMRNTLSYEEKDIASVFNNNFMQAHATKSVPRNDSTNSIQVHIAIPFDYQSGKKRSPLDPIRVRKVFSAKMSSPVDLEYQVHSFEGTVGHTASPSSTDDGLSPGMYLLVGKPKNGYALKPVKGKIGASDLKTRQVSVGTSASMTEAKPTETREMETTSIKNLAKVTLSKDFIAAVNKQLIDLYENLTRVNKQIDRKTRNTRSVLVSCKLNKDQEKSETKKSTEKYVKRRINWDAVKTYFGHDRVCSCKCTANKAMCRACAASDAVIDELIFEFDNIGKYMKDHCTEIQTFFWMNPSGGQKLRDTVSRIDKSLGDYYKRVKGKCQGRTCKTFTAGIDKRQIASTFNIPREDVLSHLINDLSAIADDLNRTVSLKACYNEKLKNEGDKLLQGIYNCISRKPLNKRSNQNTTKRKLVKNVYSLDNINVNIICNPEVSTTTDGFEATTTQATHPESTPRVGDHLFDYEIDDSKHKKRKGFKKLFPRKNKKEKLFTYYIAEATKKPKLHFKRELNHLMASSLISDGGGAFWYDYLKGSTNEPRIVRESSKDEPKFGISVFKKGGQKTPKVQIKSENKNNPPVNTIYLTVKTSPKREVLSAEVETTTDYLSHNINQLLQLFGSLQDIEAMNMHSNRSTMFLPSTAKKGASNEKSKMKKSTKVIKKVKTTMHYKDSPKVNISNTPSLNISDPIKEVTKPLETKLKDLSSTTIDSIESKDIGTTTPLPKSTTTVTSDSSLAMNPTAPDSDSSTANPDTTATLNPETSSSLNSDTSTKFNSDTTKLIPETSSKLNSDTSTRKPENSGIIDSKTSAGTQTSTTEATFKKADTESTKSRKPSLSSEVKKLTSLLAVAPNKQNKDVFDARPIFKITQSSKHGKTTTKSGFYKKMKTATLKFLDNVNNNYPDYEPHTSSPIVIKGKDENVSPVNIIEGESEMEMNLDDFEELSQINTHVKPTTVDFEESSQITTHMSPTIVDFEESSQITTHMSPTIVIINEYDNQISSDILNDSIKNSEGYKNLLLSIIQYETNRLNDEWHKIAYGSDRDDGDIKRSIAEMKKDPVKPKTPKPKPKVIEEYDVMHGLKNLELPESRKDVTEKHTGLLNKIASKIGMKVVSGGKKKVVKKANLREVTKKTKNKPKRKKGKEIDKNWKTTPTLEEACDTRRTTKASQICDIQATYNHVLDLHKTLPRDKFESFVKNISCFKYKKVDKSFFIPYKSDGKRWDWIRNKRSLKLHFSRIKDDETGYDDELGFVNFDNDYDCFEKFVKGDDGIYKIIKRKKRTASLKDLDIGLRNIPPLMPEENEMYVMAGDVVTFDCLPYVFTPEILGKKVTWRTDRKSMMDLDNVEVNGIKVTINNVEAKNVGTYTCSQDNVVQRNVRVSVMNLPAYDVVFLPVYKTQRTCVYEDLKAIQRLGDSMAEENGCGNACSIRIDEPVCQRDRGTNSTLIRSAAVISMTPRRLNCSVQCRRDLVSSLVMLCAANTPALSSVGVVISKNGVNQTMRPCKQLVRPVVTRSLRKKDSNGHHEYHKLVSTLSPGKVDVVLICPAGYYLIQDTKICGSCPSNTSSARGDNTCTACPRGTRSEPGAARCSAAGTQPRRYDWWWYPPCGYLVACCGLVCGCGVCVVIAMLVHIHSRDSAAEEMSNYGERRKPKMRTSNAAYACSPRTRPLSPSRVILARFFKPSLTSSRATDSQETKFELWKERNIPPPLPPIDFDI